METNQSVSQPTSEVPVSSGKNKKQLLLIAGVLGVIVLLSVTFLLLGKKSQEPSVSSNEKVVAKVGNEKIYQKDLNKELVAYPPVKDAKKIVIDKMVNDSIALQAAQKQNLVKLDSSIYNSPDKDYSQRIAAIQKVQNEVNKEEAKIEGTVVGIWFYNMSPAPIGLQQGQQIALQKITDLWQKVKSGQMTIQQAGDAVKNDTSLAQVDKSYKENAILSFSVGKGQKITFSQDFDKQLLVLKGGQVSDVALLWDTRSNGKTYPAMYTFGIITKNTISSNTPDYEAWLAQQKKNYEVTMY